MGIKKNIILIDLNYSLIHSLYDSKFINIHSIILSTEIQKNELMKIYDVENIYTMETIQEFYKSSEYILDYNLLGQYKLTQVKVENWFNRITSDINLVQYLYANALSYWNNIFVNNKIDGVVYEGHEYGSNFDSVIFDVAKNNNVNVFLIELVLENGSNLYAFSIFDYVTKKYIKLDKEKLKLKDININDYLYYEIMPIKQKNKSIKEYLMQYPDKYGGYLLIMFFALVLGKYKGVLHSFKISWFTIFSNYIHSKRTLSHYKSISKPLDSSKKYIFYALHMEPEAATLTRTTFSNQLIIIKSIAQNLPKGWILYVKEHPHQFSKLNNFERYYFLSSLNKFKTKSYYDEIINIPNVELLDIATKSNSIMENAQAISTINGTIALEAMVLHKPILLFSQNTTPFQNLNNIYNISNSIDLKNAINKIKSDNMVEYRELDKLILDYFFEAEFGKDNDYKALIETLILRDKIK